MNQEEKEPLPRIKRRRILKQGDLEKEQERLDLLKSALTALGSQKEGLTPNINLSSKEGKNRTRNPGEVGEIVKERKNSKKKQENGKESSLSKTRRLIEEMMLLDPEKERKKINILSKEITDLIIREGIDLQEIINYLFSPKFLSNQRTTFQQGTLLSDISEARKTSFLSKERRILRKGFRRLSYRIGGIETFKAGLSQFLKLLSLLGLIYLLIASLMAKFSLGRPFFSYFLGLVKHSLGFFLG